MTSIAPLIDAKLAQERFRRAARERREAFAAAVEAGYGYRDVAEAAGLTSGTVHYLLNGRKR